MNVLFSIHALERFEERFGGRAIAREFREAVPWDSVNRDRFLLAPCGAIFVITRNGHDFVKTVLTKEQAEANMPVRRYPSWAELGGVR